MKISVITVAYNSAATLADTLSSVAQQTHADVEHIVVDGGSTDGTLDLLAAHGTHLAKVISGPDGGIYDAMNKGLRLARGEFVGFLNADDVFASVDVLQTIARAAGAAERPDATYGDLQYVNVRNIDQVVRLWRSGPYSRSRLAYGWMPPHPTFYLRRSRLDAIGEFDTRLRIAADYDFMLRCLNQTGFTTTYVPKVLVRMRTGGASNRSIKALWNKSSEDLAALRKNRVGGIPTLLCKNLRKLPQFFANAPPTH